MGLSAPSIFIYIGAMQKKSVLQLIDEKLKQLDETEKESIWKGKLNFGVHLNVYKDSPYLASVLKKRKFINRLIFFEAFAIPILVHSFGSSIWSEESIWKTIIKILLSALFVGGVFIYTILRSLVNDTNSAQNEVKRLMLHDLRQKVEMLEEVSDPAVQKTGAGSF